MNATEPKMRQFFELGRLLTLYNVFIVVPIVYVVVWLTYTLLLTRQRKIPGPFLAKITGLWEVKKVFDGDIHKTMIKLHERYGPIVRIAPNRYDFNTLDAVKTIYRIGDQLPKSNYYTPFGSPHGKNLLNTLDNTQHGSMKKKFASLYSMSTLLSYEPAVDSQTFVLRKKLDEFAASGELVDIPTFFQYYAFDVIGMLTFGSSMNLMKTNADAHGACAALDLAWRFASVMGLLPGLFSSLETLVKVFRLPITLDGLESVVTEHVNRHMDKAAQADGSKKDATFLSKVLTLRNEGKVADKEVRVCMEMNISAGSDTTGISLSAIMYYLYTNPSVLERLRHELDTRSKAGRLSDMATYQETQQIPYLQAVIKESPKAAV
ncbi:hypothetical protein ACJQWK_00361 [Exserohilum turcicum]